MPSHLPPTSLEDDPSRKTQGFEGELTEARRREAATAEILRAIGDSRGNAQPVFEIIARNAVLLCDAMWGGVFTFDGTLLHFVAGHALSEDALQHLRDEYPIAPRGVNRLAISDRTAVHVVDSLNDQRVANVELVRKLGYRRHIVVPILQAGSAIGTIHVYGAEAVPFSAAQITMLQSFADQAAIALENGRLFTELQENNHALAEAHAQVSGAFERESATNEILRVIGKSPTDVQPVFETIARSGVTVCGALGCVVIVVDGGMIRVAATHGVRQERLERFHHQYPVPLSAELDTARTIRERCVFHLANIENNPNAAAVDRENARLGGYQTRLMVPMVRGDRTLGLIAVTREDPAPFPDQLVELLKTFADQAVIAIENARLFNETQEALERQTATADILSVISESPTDVRPVFQAIAERARQLCKAEIGATSRLEGSAVHLAGVSGPSAEAEQAMRAFFPVELELAPANIRHALAQRAPYQIFDVHLEPGYPDVGAADRMGVRSILSVPLLHDGSAIGTIGVARGEPGRFSNETVALLQTFARQAVIAIENTRLFEEVQTRTNELAVSLEHQTATSDVLGAIARSPNDLQPVLETLAETALRLCESYDVAVFLRKDDWMHLKVLRGPVGNDNNQNTFPVARGYVMGSAVLNRRVIHVPDLRAAQSEFPEGHASSVKLGHRTILAVPLMRRGDAIGVIVLRRFEIKPFSDRQIALLRTFADQAVIAIENTRLFEAEQSSKRELQEALEHQTATSNVLEVISSSPGQLQPVFDRILVKATQVCGANFGNLFLCEGETLRHVAMFGAQTEFAELRRRNPVVRPAPNSILDRLIRTKQPQHIRDFREEQSFLDRAPASVQLVEIAGARTVLGVPLVSANKTIGIIAIYRREVEPFTNKQVDLVKNFADQAVIAIENTRLLNELRESLQQQTATADVLKVISRSALDVQRVLDALVESVARLCNAHDVAIFQVFGGGLRLVAHHGQIATVAPVGQLTIPVERGTMAARAVIDRRTIQVADMLAEGREYPESRKRALQNGHRTALAVPLVHAGEAIGVLLMRRGEVRPFGDRQVELVNTFADQAVIAIENARLFEEVQSRTRELAKTVEDLEIASQHKSQFVANMSHELRTPLAAILGYAELMQEGFYEPQGKKSLDALTRIRSNGKHLLGLINTVLDIAKIESGQFTLNMSEYDVQSIVETVRSATESLAQNKKLALTTDVAKKLPIGMGDEQRLTQVLLNLVGNAIKFTDTGEVRISATALNGHFNVAVTDTGPGIPTDQLTRVFEQFHQVDSSNTKAKGGTGLGLAIAKQIVEMHGGRIWVESTLGQGSSFHLELPVRAQSRQSAP